MKRKTRAVTKQLIKYGIIIIAFITFFFLIKLLSDIPKGWQIGIAILGILILIISAIFDWSTTKDLIPIFKG